MKIAIYGRSLSSQYFSFAKELFEVLNEKNIDVIVHERFRAHLSEHITLQENVKSFSSHEEMEGVDYVFSIGGDGTLLEATTFVRQKSIPILGINTGRLGFLTTVTTENISGTIEDILNKSYELDKRSMLNVVGDGKKHDEIDFALNEVTVQKKDTSSMITINVYLDDEFLNAYWADGLIISTPTGSTAYSMSCNGPIILPRSGNIVLTPIAPHNLNVRPLVIPDDSELTLKIEGRTENYLVALDSRSLTVPISTELTIRKSDYYMVLVRLKGYHFLDTLRSKLIWGMDKRN